MGVPGPEAGVARAGRREERKAQNRAKLLDAARKVFARKGLGEATARDIVRETDLASGTFYNYFRDKEDAFGALLQEMAERSRAIVREQRRDPDVPVEERVANAYRAYFEWSLEERELFQVFRRNAGAVATDARPATFELGIVGALEDLDRVGGGGRPPGRRPRLPGDGGCRNGLPDRDPPRGPRPAGRGGRHALLHAHVPRRRSRR